MIAISNICFKPQKCEKDKALVSFTFYWIKPQTKPFTWSYVPEVGKSHPICSSVSFVLFHLDLIDWATNRQYWFGHKILIPPLWNILKDLLTMKLMALQVLLSSSMQGTWKFKGKHDTYRWYLPTSTGNRQLKYRETTLWNVEAVLMKAPESDVSSIADWAKYEMKCRRIHNLRNLSLLPAVNTVKIIETCNYG